MSRSETLVPFQPSCSLEWLRGDGSASAGAQAQNRRTVTLKDMIAADNGNYMQSHVDVVHNRLNPDDLQVDSLLRPTM